MHRDRVARHPRQHADRAARPAHRRRDRARAPRTSRTSSGTRSGAPATSTSSPPGPRPWATGSSTRRSGSSRGSSRSSGRGPTATAIRCSIFTRDQLLDNVTVYWFTGTGASSGRLYWESAGPAPPLDPATMAALMGPVTVPTGCSVFPREIRRPVAPLGRAALHEHPLVERARRRAATSPRSNSPSSSSTRCAPRSDRCDEPGGGRVGRARRLARARDHRRPGGVVLRQGPERSRRRCREGRAAGRTPVPPLGTAARRRGPGRTGRAIPVREHRQDQRGRGGRARPARTIFDSSPRRATSSSPTVPIISRWAEPTRRRSSWRSRRSGSPARTRATGHTISSSFHAGGEGSILPSGPGWQQFPERPPIQVGGELAEYDAGWNAAVAVLGAMYDRLRTGRGQQIDVSIQESELTLNRTRLSRFNNDDIVLRREGSRYGFMGMMRCRDGWVQLVGVTPAQWDALAASPDAGDLADPRIATAAARAENMELAAAALQAWCEQHDKADVVRILAPLGCPVGAYATPSDLVGVGATRAPRVLPRGRRRPRWSCARSRAAVSLFGDAGRDPIGADPRQRRPGSARTRRQASAAARPRPRGRAGPRLHLGRRGPVRHVPARAARRRGGQGRVARHAPTRPGAASSPTTAASTAHRTSTSSTSASGRSRSTSPKPDGACARATGSRSGPTSSSTTSAPAS